MTTLSLAPLIEAIFEFRWGEVERLQGSDQVRFSFSPNESELLPGQFKQLVAAEGFTTDEAANPGLPALPHTVKYRFRKAPDAWPCYQIGLGIFTVNQVNDGYGGARFKKQIQDGLTILGKTQKDGLKGLNGIGVELRYQDGFILDENESAADFLKKNMAIDFLLPKDFTANDNIGGDLQGNTIAFHLDVKNPAGILLVSLDQALINGKSGFVMTTTMRSADNNKPEFTLEKLATWVENAHNVHKHTFKTLISKAYARSFE